MVPAGAVTPRVLHPKGAPLSIALLALSSVRRKRSESGPAVSPQGPELLAPDAHPAVHMGIQHQP